MIFVITSYSIHYTKLYEVAVHAVCSNDQAGADGYAVKGGHLAASPFKEGIGEVSCAQSNEDSTPNRITSYNVCYTKLLRFILIVSLYRSRVEAHHREATFRKTISEFQHRNYGATVYIGHIQPGDSFIQGPLNRPNLVCSKFFRINMCMGRITSYNVCYTKLLRRWTSWAASPPRSCWACRMAVIR